MLATTSQTVPRPSRTTKKHERFDENDLMLDSSGEILSGSAEALLRRLVPTPNADPPNAAYVFTMLLNMRTVMSPEEIMHKIVQHVMFSQNAAAENFKKEGRQRMCGAVLALCQEWTQQLPYDFRAPAMRDRLDELLGFCSVDPAGRQRANTILETLKAMLTKYERYERALRSLAQKESDEPATMDESLCGLISICPSAAVLAYQVTHIELERFSMVGADEILDAVAKCDIACIGQHTGSNELGNIAHYVCWSNRLSALVAADVLQHAKRKHRIQVIEWWVEAARECVNAGNLNSVVAIVAGLARPAVSRLRNTWAKVDKAKLDILQHQLDPSGNFLSYRATLKAAAWRADVPGTSDVGSTQQVILPFFVLLLKDIYLLYHGNTRILPNGHLNYMAFAQVAEQIADVQRWKRRKCSFERNPRVLQYLLTTQVLSERAMMLMSFECEAPETSSEKEQHKKLKLQRS